MRNIYTLIAGLILIMMSVAIFRASQPDAGVLKWRVDDEGYAYGNGYTDSGSLMDFEAFIRENSQVHTLVLQRMSGTQDLVTNQRIARMIRRKGLNTHLQRSSAIASGAVDLFIAGVERTMDCGARIGVHSWRIGANEGALVQGPEISPRTLGTDQFKNFQESFMRDMGIDPAFYVFTREAAPPDRLYFLNLEDIERFNLTTSSDVCLNT